METATELLKECDELLAYFEDFTHGNDGNKITALRKKLQFIYTTPPSNSDEERFNINNLNVKGGYDLEWDDELYNAFCEMYHDDGSNDEKLRIKLKKLLLKFLKANAAPRQEVILPTEKQKILTDDKDDEEEKYYDNVRAIGWNDCIKQIKYLNPQLFK